MNGRDGDQAQCQWDQLVVGDAGCGAEELGFARTNEFRIVQADDRPETLDQLPGEGVKSSDFYERGVRTQGATGAVQNLADRRPREGQGQRPATGRSVPMGLVEFAAHDGSGCGRLAGPGAAHDDDHRVGGRQHRILARPRFKGHTSVRVMSGSPNGAA